MSVEYLEKPLHSRNIVIGNSLRARFANVGDRTSVEITPRSMNPEKPYPQMNIFGIIYPQPCMLELDYVEGEIESMKYTTIESPVETHYLWQDGILIGSDTLYSASQPISNIPKVNISDFRIKDHFGNLVSKTCIFNEVEDYIYLTTTYSFADFDGKYESRDKLVIAKLYENYNRRLIKPAFGLSEGFYMGVNPIHVSAFKCDPIINQELFLSDKTILKYNQDFDDYELPVNPEV